MSSRRQFLSRRAAGSQGPGVGARLAGCSLATAPACQESNALAVGHGWFVVAFKRPQNDARGR